MAMGKLWEEAANTAEARDMSFLSRNSGKQENQKRSMSSNFGAPDPEGSTKTEVSEVSDFVLVTSPSSTNCFISIS